MKTKIITLTFVIMTITMFGQISPEPVKVVLSKDVPEQGSYQLFPTKNQWTFIKLNTSNGKMWQVHFAIDKDNATGEIILNSKPLVTKEKEFDGRFTLYPTENIYNFLLLDRIDGTVIQVQWSFESNKRGIVTEIKPIE